MTAAYATANTYAAPHPTTASAPVQNISLSCSKVRDVEVLVHLSMNGPTKARLLIKTVDGGLTLLDDVVGAVLGPIPIGDVTVHVLKNHEFAVSNMHWSYHISPGTYRSVGDGKHHTRHR